MEHGFYINDECLSLMAKKKTIWVPTVTPIVNLIGKGLYPDSVLKRIAVEQLENVKKALEIGCIIAVGSDAGAHNVFHGKGITQEIRYLTPCFKSKNQMYEVLSEGERIISQRFKSPKLH